MPNMHEIELFDSHGAMRPLDQIAPQLENADAATRERFEVVKLAYEQCRDVEAAIKFSTDRVANLVSEIRESENMLRTHYAPQTQIAAIRAVIETNKITRGIR